VKIKYVSSYQDRHGKTRYRYRCGGRVTQLPDNPESREFMEAYNACINGDALPSRLRLPRGGPGSFDALIAAYYTTAAFKELAPITQKNYRTWLERFRNERGNLMVGTFERRHASVLLDELAGKPGAQKSLRRMLNILLNLAVEHQLVTANCMAGVRRSKVKRESFWRSWTDEDIEAYERRWPSGSRERLALALLLYTAQRRTDVVGWGRQHVRGGILVHATSKSNETTKLEIPLHPALKAELDLVPKTQMHFLLTQYGEPFTANGFGGWLHDKVRAAGITEQASAHGLRKACCRRLAEAGCTPHQIMAITGHKNLAEVTTYTKAADQKRLAISAIAALGGVQP
jgi:integrase